MTREHQELSDRMPQPDPSDGAQNSDGTPGRPLAGPGPEHTQTAYRINSFLSDWESRQRQERDRQTRIDSIRSAAQADIRRAAKPSGFSAYAATLERNAKQGLKNLGDILLSTPDASAPDTPSPARTRLPEFELLHTAARLGPPSAKPTTPTFHQTGSTAAATHPRPEASSSRTPAPGSHAPAARPAEPQGPAAARRR